MEYLQLFDKNRNILDEKVDRSHKLELKDGKHFMIVMIFIENEKGEFLLQKTSVKKQSHIATTGGHVTYGDTGYTTIKREVMEELGLDISGDDPILISKGEYGVCFGEVYYLKKNVDIDSLVLQEDEVESVRWYTKEEILDLIKNNNFREGNVKPFFDVLKYLDGDK